MPRIDYALQKNEALDKMSLKFNLLQQVNPSDLKDGSIPTHRITHS